MQTVGPRHRVKSSSWLPVVLAGGLGVVGGLAHGNSGALGAGLALLAGPLVALAMVKRALRRLRVSRELLESAFEGDSVEVRIRLTNESVFALSNPIVTDVFAPELHGEKRMIFVGRLVRGETAELRYSGACILPRGIYRPGPLTIVATDPFGWFEVRRTVDLESAIKVYPAVQPLVPGEPLGQVISRVRSDLALGGPGASDAYFATRDYRRGDPLRIVHWGLTAHRGSPVVREFQKNSRRELVIFLDRHRNALIGIGRGSSMEHSVKIAAALAADAIARGHRVRLVAGDGEFATRASAGRDHLRSILDVLVRVKASDNRAFVDVLSSNDAALRAGTSAVVMVSPYLHADVDIVERLDAWRRRGVEIAAVVYDAPTFRRLEGWANDGGDTGAFCERLRARGIRTFPVACMADLRVVFAETVP